MTSTTNPSKTALGRLSLFPRQAIGRLPLVAALLAALFVVGPAGVVSAEGRQLTGSFCSNPQALPKPGACMSLSYGDETAIGYTNAPDRVLTLRPGTYWLAVDDTSTAHNFSLRSPDGSEQAITGVVDTPGWVTVKVHLAHGTYVLFCAADDHEQDGMYVDIEVGGVGQVE